MHGGNCSSVHLLIWILLLLAQVQSQDCLYGLNLSQGCQVQAKVNGEAKEMQAAAEVPGHRSVGVDLEQLECQCSAVSLAQGSNKLRQRMPEQKDRFPGLRVQRLLEHYVGSICLTSWRRRSKEPRLRSCGLGSAKARR